MAEDWAAVAGAINQRMAELGLRQRELVERSRVSKAAVREIQHNTVQRRRSARTLEALSGALDWHPQHLDAVLAGRRPPQLGDPMVLPNAPNGHGPNGPNGDLPARLASIERWLSEITDRLDRLGAMRGQLDQICADLATVTQQSPYYHDNPREL